jgi:hypothetical protein
VLSSVKHLHNFINIPKQSSKLKSAVKQTIAEIHARLAQGEEAGRLSVSEIETGEGSLSIVQNSESTGALSVTQNTQRAKRRKNLKTRM